MSQSKAPRCVVWLLVIGWLSGASAEAVSAPAEGLSVDENWRFVSAGPLSGDCWAELEANLAQNAPRFLRVRVQVTERVTPMLGDYRRVGNSLSFVPRFPFRPNVRYVAEFDPRGMLGQSIDEAVQLEFHRQVSKPLERHRVEQVFPTANRLPENLLKFYLHFSGPMSRGEAYRRVRLIDQRGGVIALPFLELGEELWDPDGKRLTLLFDPGRIKRGLKPREQEGQVLEAGNRYTLQIDEAWPDANGMPLREGFQRQFSVGPADYKQPDSLDWILQIPAVGSRDLLLVTFPEPLDHAMLQRVMRVVGANGLPVVGQVAVKNAETQWQFRPKHRWRAGDYRLRFDKVLEDVAGNSIGRPFELLQGTVPKKVRLERSFSISPAN
ncbi:MAG: hypothetical protein P8N76_11040 [Pirellulaceae bacterium]|nr:hypothetical protein [Pirellulaceae bacterium]